MALTTMNLTLNTYNGDLNDSFMHYFSNFFKFPMEIKNDIIYCQRALKAHIKVHQMVLDVFQFQEDADPAQIKEILEELESEIYEINAEQHFLFMRLRRIIAEFYKMLKVNGIEIDHIATNGAISMDVAPFVYDERIPIKPVTVQYRNSEQKLIAQYFDLEKECNYYEILDSDDDLEGDMVVIAEPATQVGTPSIINNQLNVVEELATQNGNAIEARNMHAFTNANTNVNGMPQTSLLKPMAQRLVIQSVADASSGGASAFADAVVPYPQSVNQQQISIAVDELPSTCSAPVATELPTELPVSKNVKMSRLNLRQALKKARTDNMAAKARAQNAQSNGANAAAPAATNARTTKTPSPPVPAAAARKRAAAPKRAEKRKRAGRPVATATKNGETDYSEESNPATSPNFYYPCVISAYRNDLAPYGQEKFLHFIGLCTWKAEEKMRQRHSKRERRNVFDALNSVYFCEHSASDSAPQQEDDKKEEKPQEKPQEKKRKTFLQVKPRVKRNQNQAKRKRNSADNKRDEKTPSPTTTSPIESRAGSSSPDEKNGCNKCLKSGGTLSTCNGCKGYFHQICHTDVDDEKPTTSKRAAANNAVKYEMCPACQRAQDMLSKEENQNYNKSLQGTAQTLEMQMVREKNRHSSLQQESKLYKVQMRKLFSIVNTFKSDQENDSSE